MKKLLLIVFVGVLAACAAPQRLVVSNGFSFADYEYLVIAKPESAAAQNSLYGMDLEFANLLATYSLKIVGDKEAAAMSSADQHKTLVTRLGVSSTDKLILMSASFDDVLTGRTLATISAREKGELADDGDRKDAFDALTEKLTAALAKDKGLAVEKPGFFSSATKLKSVVGGAVP